MFVKTKNNIYDVGFLFEDSNGNYINDDLEMIIKKEDIIDRSEDLQMLFDAFIVYSWDGFIEVTNYKTTKHMKCSDLDETYFDRPPMDEEHTLYGAIFVWEEDELGQQIFNIKTVTKGRKKGQFFSLK